VLKTGLRAASVVMPRVWRREAVEGSLGPNLRFCWMSALLSMSAVRVPIAYLGRLHGVLLVRRRL
jgi:hypothetical protein